MPRARRIAAPHGLSHHERDLVTEGLHYIRRNGPAAFVSIEAGKSPDAEKIVRGVARRIKSDIALRQRRAGMRRVLSITVLEALDRGKKPKFGAHIVAGMRDATARDRLIESLNVSTAYGSATVLAKTVTDWPGLTGYLLKEATPQAWYGAGKGFRRVGGSIRLGELGGDRVIPSRDLKDMLVKTGTIEPYQRSYAKRLPKARALLAEIEVRHRCAFEVESAAEEAPEDRAAEPAAGLSANDRRHARSPRPDA